jgi:hypothetical protein
MNSHSLPVTNTAVSNQKRAMIWRSNYLRGRGFERVRAMVVKLTAEMTAPLRQPRHMLRGKVAIREKSELRNLGSASPVRLGQSNHKANKKRP